MSRLAFIIAVLWISAGNFALAADYLSIAEGSAIFYDAPSTKAKKIFVGSRYLPLEQVVSLEGWVKVRDSSGKLSWVEKRMLSDKRTVLVTAPLASVRKMPEAEATIVFQAILNVSLEWLEDTHIGWIKVRHLDGATGYVKASEVWGY
ncbi:MAG: SH3 domain-containing protein [Candidatus Nitrotoga sp.]